MTIPIGSGHGITNLEGHSDFDIVWPWNQPGGLRVTAASGGTVSLAWERQSDMDPSRFLVYDGGNAMIGFGCLAAPVNIELGKRTEAPQIEVREVPIT